MRRNQRALSILLLVCGLGGSCQGGGGDDGGDGGGYPGVWQYQEGSFSFVNCYFSSTNVPLARSGFQVVEEGGALVRVNPDGCRFTVVPTTSRHAHGVAGETCTVSGMDILGNPMTTVYTLKSLVMELDPDHGTQMIEVFAIAATNTTTVGSYDCEITGNNTLDRAP
jgi:hypothetical protein